MVKKLLELIWRNIFSVRAWKSEKITLTRRIFRQNNYRKVSISTRGYYSFPDLTAAGTIWGRALSKGGYYSTLAENCCRKTSYMCHTLKVMETYILFTQKLREINLFTLFSATLCHEFCSIKSSAFIMTWQLNRLRVLIKGGYYSTLIDSGCGYNLRAPTIQGRVLIET